MAAWALKGHQIKSCYGMTNGKSNQLSTANAH